MADAGFENVLGLHWIIDALDCESPRLGDIAHMRVLLQSLPRRLGLTVVGEVQTFEHVDPGGQRTIAGLVLISESHLSLHARPELKTLHADIFSCKPFEIASARDALVEAYSFTNFEESVFERGRLRSSSQPGLPG